MNIANVFRHPLGYGFLMDITTPNNGGYYVSQNFSQASRWGEIWERELFGSRGDADLGEPVYAVANGQAVYSYVEDGDNNGWGKTIILQHILPDGEIVYSQYSNLESARDLETVDVGEQIGTLGNTGNAATAQLYFSINEIGDEFLVRSEPSNFDGLFDPTDFINEHRFIGAPSRESTHSDLTGDGTDDVIWHNPTQGEVGFWDVGGSYRPYTLLSETTTTHWKVVATGDFTADGTDDVLLRNTINGTVGYWDVTDGATRWVNLSNQVSQVWEVAGMGDFTGDGTADVLWYNTQNGAVGIWDITQSQTRWELLTNANSSSWEIAGIGDFTNDGVSDVLWYNSSNATVGYWEMISTETARTISSGVLKVRIVRSVISTMPMERETLKL